MVVKNEWSKQIIVVLGMHRSGTSAVARALQVLGVSLGNNLLQKKIDNSKGFYEDADINSLNIEMLEALGASWHQLAPIESNYFEILKGKGYFLRAVEVLNEKVSGTALFAFKDPRVIKLFSFWQAVFEYCQLDVGYVLATRNPLSVAKSLEKRDGFPMEKGYLLWLEHLVNVTRENISESCVIVDYDRLMQDPKCEIERISCAFCLQIIPEELAIYNVEFLDKDLRHHAWGVKDLHSDVNCPQVVMEAYDALIKIADNKINVRRMDLFNLFNTYYDEYKRFKPILALVDKSYGLVGRRELEIDRARQKIDELVAEIETARVAHFIRDETEQNLKKSIYEKDKEILIFQKEISKFEKQLGAIKNKFIYRLLKKFNLI